MFLNFFLCVYYIVNEEDASAPNSLKNPNINDRIAGTNMEIYYLSFVTRWTKQAFPCSKFLSPGDQLWANTAFEGSQF